MKFIPKKRVGSPASVRGIRGAYLIYMISYLAAALLSLLIVSSMSISFVFKAIGVILVFVFVIYKYYAFLKLSKGDMQMPIKDSCRISLIIKK